MTESECIPLETLKVTLLPKNIPPKNYGFVHTAELEVREEEVGAEILEEVHANSFVGVTNERKTGQMKNLHRKRWKYNPNDYARQIFLPRDGDAVYGHCQSMETFEQGLNTWITWMDLQRKDVHVVRLDFAFDRLNPKDERRLCRVYEAVVHAFAASHRILKRDQYREETLLSRELKSSKAIYGRISMEAYDRTKKHPRSRVNWRFEVRYGESVHNRPSTPLSPLEMLECLKRELSDLKDKLPYLEKEMNRYLHNDYKAKFTRRTGQITPQQMYEFVRCNSSRIFTRRQLTGLLKMMNPTLAHEKAQEKADRQIERHPADYCIINEIEYKKILSDCITEIDHYVSHKKGVYISAVCKNMEASKALQSLNYDTQQVEAGSLQNDSTDTARCARSSTTSTWLTYKEQSIESLRLSADIYPDDYVLPLTTSEPWPPFGQSSLAIGRTPPPGVSA